MIPWENNTDIAATMALLGLIMLLVLVILGIEVF